MYKYCGVELTPRVFGELLVQLFDGKQFSRQEAIKDIVSYHISNGGVAQKNEYVGTFKRACTKLKSCGLTNINFGVYRLNYHIKEIIPSQTTKKTIDYTADEVIGNGKNSVYVYYYDAYKKYAEATDKKIWECKIGRTDRDPLQRVLSQSGTCYPELPHIALIIFCDDSGITEGIIHTILRMNNRVVKDAPGKEWFITSPSEIKQIFNGINDINNCMMVGKDGEKDKNS